MVFEVRHLRLSAPFLVPRGHCSLSHPPLLIREAAAYLAAAASVVSNQGPDSSGVCEGLAVKGDARLLEKFPLVLCLYVKDVRNINLCYRMNI